MLRAGEGALFISNTSELQARHMQMNSVRNYMPCLDSVDSVDTSTHVRCVGNKTRIPQTNPVAFMNLSLNPRRRWIDVCTH